MNNAISFEPIQPWNGVTGSGKDARLSINRNFQQLSDFLSTLVFGVLSDGSIEHIVAIEEAVFEPLRLAGQLDEKTYYIVLNPTQQSNIEQLLTSLSADLDSKANAQAVADALSFLSEELGFKANQQDLESLVGLLETSVIEQYPDWTSIFTRNGSFVFVDDEHGMNRPEGFFEPGIGVQRKYNVFTWAVSPLSRPTSQVKDMTEGNLFILTLQVDNTITVLELANSAQIGQISTALDSIQSLITAIIG